MSRPAWIALESNPDMMNTYVRQMGVPASCKVAFTDVFGVDPDLLGMVPHPVHAVMLLYPITVNTLKAEQAENEAAAKVGSEEHKLAEAARVAVMGDGAKAGGGAPPAAAAGTEAAEPEEQQQALGPLWFTHQTIGNACGTVAVMHAMMNMPELMGFADDSALGKFRAATAKLTPEARAGKLEQAEEVAESHEAVAQTGQTAAPAPEARINLHFVTLLHHDGRLYEMDGRCEWPKDRGATSPDTLLEDAARVIREVHIARDPTEHNFSVIALSTIDED